MRIEIIKAFGPHSIGATLPDVPGNLAREWIRRNLAREMPAEEIKSVAAPVDRQMKAGRPGRRDYATK